MARPRRPTRSLRRTVGTRTELRTVVVYCEGKVSEPEYLRAFKSLPEVRRRTSLRIEIAPTAAVPYPLVQVAAERRRDTEVDEVWCFFDIEAPQQHPRLTEALALAEAKGVRVAVSNPCFELWLVLHHRDWSRPDTATAEIERTALTLPGITGKHIDTEVLMPLRHEAARRARLLDAHHTDNGTSVPHGNPSSGVYAFLDAHDPEAPRLLG